MDPRTAAHVLARIAAFLELRGESQFKSRAYQQAARVVATLDTDDLGALDRAGDLARTPGVGKAILSVIRDLIETGDSRYLDQLSADLPPGLVDLVNLPGLPTQKILVLHQALGIDSIDSLESAARDGRLATLKGFGPRTAAKILRGIEIFRTAGSEVEPDLMVRHWDAADDLKWEDAPIPSLVVEVLSGSTRRRDLGAKRDLYLDIGVDEYWVVDREDRSILVMRPGRAPERVVGTLVWNPAGASQALAVDVASIFG